jgi:hypothetical protein
MKLSIAACLCLTPLLAAGQDASQAAAAAPTPAATPIQARIPMWRCELPGGIYEVAIRSIISVSTHEYVVDGVARVTELNIETPGDTEVRYYYLEPLTTTSPIGVGQSAFDKAQEAVTEAASRLSPDQEPPWEKVVKNYPTTTHAHTVEYRVDSKDDLETLFNSVDQAFRLNQNTTIVLEGGQAEDSSD